MSKYADAFGMNCLGLDSLATWGRVGCPILASTIDQIVFSDLQVSRDRRWTGTQTLLESNENELKLLALMLSLSCKNIPVSAHCHESAGKQGRAADEQAYRQSAHPSPAASCAG